MPIISPTAISPHRIGGKNWSSYWATRLPYFALPSAGINLMVGKEATIYGDSLINVPIGSDLTVTYTCDIGIQSGNNLSITPDAADIGSHACQIVFVSNGVTRSTQTINLNVYADCGAGTVKVLLVGDSLVANGITNITTGLNDYLTPTVTYIGSKGTTIKHEGISGATWLSMVGDTSPFVKGGVIDIPAYFADNSLDTPDYVFIRLGVNDMWSRSNVQNSDANLANTIIRAKSLITGFLNFNANLKVIVGLPTICENSGEGWKANYDESVYIQDSYIKYIHQLWDAFVTNFDNGSYDERVSLSTEAIFLDRNDGYPKTDGVHNNALHPADSGYVQLGEGLGIELNKLYNEKTAFTITAKTDNAGISANNQMTIPTTGAGYNCVIYWGDGTATAHTGTPGNITHTYPAIGTYTIRVNGVFPRIYFNNGNDCLKLLTIQQWGNIAWGSMSSAFLGCTNMEATYTDIPNLTSVTTLNSMFSQCAKFNGSVAGWDVSGVTSLAGTFNGCTIFNQDVSSWDTSSVESMHTTFRHCEGFKQSLAAWNIEAVTNFTNFMQYDNMNATGTANYDATLIAWAAQTVNASLSVHFGYAKYSAGAAATAKGVLTGAPNSWTIEDGGQA